MDETLFWTKVGAIGQVAAALATFAAVCVSLWLARSDRRAHVKVRAGLRLLFRGDGSPFVDVISVYITNYGLRPVHVSSLGWRTGWLKRGPKWLVFQHAIQPDLSNVAGRTPPFDLGPGQETLVQLAPEPFRKDGEVRDAFFNRRLPWKTGPSPTKTCAVVFISASNPVIARVEPDLETFLATGVIASGAAEANKKATEEANKRAETRARAN